MPGWNHNTHYWPDLLAAVSAGAASALDVGCGTGELTAELASRVPLAVGVDPHGPSIATARQRFPSATFVEADVMTHDLGQRFDVVCSVTAVHHLPTREGLLRARDLVAPGGVLYVVGLGRRAPWRDLPVDLVAYLPNQLAMRRRGFWLHDSPVKDPDLSYQEVRRLAASVLPGSRYRRRLYFRYTISWTAPG